MAACDNAAAVRFVGADAAADAVAARRPKPHMKMSHMVAVILLKLHPRKLLTVPQSKMQNMVSLFYIY